MRRIALAILLVIGIAALPFGMARMMQHDHAASAQTHEHHPHDGSGAGDHASAPHWCASCAVVVAGHGFATEQPLAEPPPAALPEELAGAAAAPSDPPPRA